jgi:predicted outer membrane repeat protein
MYNDSNNGGGINANYGSAPVITYCTFVENSAEKGGGMIIWDTDGVTMSDCVFEGNVANVEGGGVYASVPSDGSGAANLTLLSCSFTNNTASAFGGGIFSRPDANTTIIDTLACGNTPDQVYGEYIDGGENTITDECPLGCPDINGDSNVDVIDLLLVIGYWGTHDSSADVNSDGIVDVLDLLQIIAAWGTCP